MRDSGFGVLPVAPLRSSGSSKSLLGGGGGGTYRPSAAGPAAAATPFGPRSPPPPPLPVTGFAEAASPFPAPLGGGGGRAGSSSAAASSSSRRPPARPRAMQDEPLLGLTPRAAAAEKLPNHRPGGGTNAGVTHLLPSQDFQPSLHLPASSSSASSCCGCRTSSPQDFSERQQQQRSGQKRKE